MDHTGSVSDSVTVIPIQHAQPDDSWKRVTELERQVAWLDERLLALEEWHYRCRQLDDELCRAAGPRRKPLPADPDLSDLR